MAAATAAVLVGNLSSAIDAILPRAFSCFPPRARCCLAACSSTTSTNTSLRYRTTPPRWRTRSSSSDFDGLDGGGGDEEDDLKEWEVEMRRRLQEMEEMRELEKRAEELQTRLTDEYGEGGRGDEGEGEGEGEDEEEKRNRVRRELEKLAKEQAERRETAKLMYELGQRAYGKGMYGRAIEFLEGALTIIPRTSIFGGEIQIWLAMAYDANNRHKDCIELYRQLEKQHPSVSIRRQASELRYISQAPKLKITKDEMVTIPLIGSSYDRYAGTWSDKNKKRDWITVSSQSASSQDPWGNYVGWRPPTGWEKSRMLWVAVTLWLGVVGIILLLQN